MHWILKLLLNALGVFITALLLPGVEVKDYFWAVVVALVLGILNTILRPILIFLTLPATLISLGLFILVINAGIILITDWLVVEEFEVANFWWALLFSLIVSLLNSFLNKLINPKPRKPEVRVIKEERIDS
jgi:putative membrane protein